MIDADNNLRVIDAWIMDSVVTEEGMRYDTW